MAQFARVISLKEIMSGDQQIPQERINHKERINLIKTVCRLAGTLALALGVFAVSPLSPAFAAAGPAYTQAGGSHAATHAPAVHIALNSCTYGASSGNVHTCMSWSNNGNIINSIDGTAEVVNVQRTITVCIRSSVVGTIKCNPAGYIPVGPGGHIAVDWSPARPEPSGQYCVRTWRKNADDGSNTLIGEVCTTIS
jgi:hypothetical protein